MEINIRFIVNSLTSYDFKNGYWPTLTPLQKKVTALALVIFSCLMAALFFYRYCMKTKITETENDEELLMSIQEDGQEWIKTNVLKISGVAALVEADSIYEGDLSVEKEAIDAWMKNPCLEELVSYINSLPNDDIHQTEALGALLVVLGIKPVITFHHTTKKELLTVLDDLTHQFKELAKAELGEAFYFANENPLEAFNPRSFLQPLSASTTSLLEATQFCFSPHLVTPPPFDFSQPDVQSDQMRSYLLGYGPAWEAYANISHYREIDFTSLSCFTDNHYRETGSVLLSHGACKNGEMNDQNAVRIGLAYNSSFPRLLGKRNLFINSMKLAEIKTSKLLWVTSTGCYFDGIAARTEYFKKSYTLKKWILETYFPSVQI